MDAGSVNLKTVQLILQATIFIVSSLLLSYLFIYVVSENIHFYNDVLGAFLILVAASISIYFAGNFSAGNTTLSISEGNLVIESRITSLNISRFKKVALNQIHLYEIRTIRGKLGIISQRLVFYRHYQVPVVIVLKTLSASEENDLISFLETNNINSTTGLKTLSGESFLQAFFRSFFTTFLGTIAFFAAYVLLLYFFYRINRRLPDLNVLLVASTVAMILMTTYFTTQKLLKIYRIGANSTWIVMGIMLPGAAFFIQDRLELFSQRPLNIKETTEIKLYPNQKFFRIGSFFCDTTLTGYYRSFSSGSRRSGSNTVKHYFTSPIITREDSSRDLKHQYWVSETYTQKISKSLSDGGQNDERISFMNQKLHDFNRSFGNTPAFFEVVYSELNPRARTENYLFPVLSIGRTKNTLLILRPHKEDFAEFMRVNWEQSFILATVFGTLLILNSLVIATNR